MRILVFGATGMLGSTLLKTLSRDQAHEVWGTLRTPGERSLLPEPLRARLVAGIDVFNPDTIVDAMNRVRPDLVINCIGIIKQLSIANDPLVTLPVNSMFPHRLAALCRVAGSRMVHISSDCVFSGRTGNYVESELSDAEDLYGKSKFIGEVRDQAHVLTLRTSIIGHELKSANGLVDWFLAQEGKIRGFSRAIYSGFPSVEIARVIREVVLPRPELHGLYHLSSRPISKLDLLTLIADTYRKKIVIEPDASVAIDRSLDSRRFTAATGYVSPAWPELIREMHAYR